MINSNSPDDSFCLPEEPYSEEYLAKLEKEVAQARQELKEGKTYSFSTVEELFAFLDSDDEEE